MKKSSKENLEEISRKIRALEAEMNSPDFWTNKQHAQAVIKELGELQVQKEGGGPYDKGDAILTIFSGAGGDDSEDFSRILISMYLKFASKKGWATKVLDQNENDHGGYRN